MSKYVQVTDFQNDPNIFPADRIVGFTHRYDYAGDFGGGHVPILLVRHERSNIHVPLVGDGRAIEIANAAREQGYKVIFATDHVTGKTAWFRTDSVVFITTSASTPNAPTKVLMGDTHGDQGLNNDGLDVRESVEELFERMRSEG